MRVLVALVLVAAAALPAAAGDLDGGTVIGLGFGPTPIVRGELAQHYTGARAAGRLRMGMRFGRLGLELAMSFSGLDRTTSTADRTGEEGSVLWAPTAVLHAVQTPWFQLGGRAGLGFGSISGGERLQRVPCDPEDDCGFRDERVADPRPLVGLDLGVTAQVHLGARRGNRAIVWADYGMQLARYQLADGAVITGRITQLTIGIGHGMAF